MVECNQWRAWEWVGGDASPWVQATGNCNVCGELKNNPNPTKCQCALIMPTHQHD